MKPQARYSKLSIYLNKRPMSSVRYHSVLKHTDRQSLGHTNRNFFEGKESSVFNPALYRLNYDSNRQNDENEMLFDECMQLKSVINKMNKEFTLLKSELIKKDVEILKINEVLRNHLTESYQTNDFLNEKMKIFEGNNLIANLKKEYNILKRELNKKENEIQEIKQGSKYIRLREFQIENQFLNEEIRRLKIINEDLLESIERAERSELNNANLKESYKKQACLLDELQEEIRVLKEAVTEKSNGKVYTKNHGQYEFTLEKMKEFNARAIKSNEHHLLESTQEKLKSNKKINLNFKKNSAAHPILVSNKKMKIKNTIDSAMKITNNMTATYMKEFGINTNSNMKMTNPTFLMTDNDHLSFHRSTSIMTDKQIKIYTYLLLETINVNINERNKFKELIKAVFYSKSFNMEEVSNSLSQILKIQNAPNDKIKILSYLLELSKMKKENNPILKNYIISLIENSKIIPTEKKLKKYKEKLQKKLHYNFSTFVNLFKIWDSNLSGIITLADLERILDSMNMALKMKYYKFMIHIMKKNSHSLNLGIEELQYKLFIDYIYSTKQEKSDERSVRIESKETKDDVNENTISKSSNNYGRGDNGSNFIEVIEDLSIDNSELAKTIEGDLNDEAEEEDVVITMKEFDQTVDRILQKFAEFLINNKKSVREFFSNKIVSVLKSSSFTTDAIALKDFVIELSQINIEMNTLDVYCIFTKLKMSEDEDEIIEVAKLSDEMLNYGICEENTNNIWNGNTSLKKSEINEQINFSQ